MEQSVADKVKVQLKTLYLSQIVYILESKVIVLFSLIAGFQSFFSMGK